MSMSILENLPTLQMSAQLQFKTLPVRGGRMRVSVIVAMAEDMTTIPRQARVDKELFTSRRSLYFEKCGDRDEIHLIFDRYDIPLSLKEATRKERQGNQQPFYKDVIFED